MTETPCFTVFVEVKCLMLDTSDSERRGGYSVVLPGRRHPRRIPWAENSVVTVPICWESHSPCGAILRLPRCNAERLGNRDSGLAFVRGQPDDHVPAINFTPKPRFSALCDLVCGQVRWGY